jgi:Phage Tail Collar Domain
MAQYPAPLIYEPIFNAENFVDLSGSSSSSSTSGSYLVYPIAQGAESFPSGLSTTSTLTFNGGVDYLTTLSQSGTEFTVAQGTGNTMTVDVPSCTFTNDVTMSDRLYFQYGGYINGGSASGSVINLVADEIDIVANALLFNALPINSYSSMSQDSSGNIVMTNSLIVDESITCNSQLYFTSSTPYINLPATSDTLNFNSNIQCTGNTVTAAVVSATSQMTSVTATAGDNSTTVATTAFVQNALSGSSGNPVGTILMFGGNTTAPSGYLFCDGSSYSQTGTYANLYAVIGTTYNLGSTPSGSFAVPNFHNGTTGSGIFPIAGGLTSGSIGVLASTGSSTGPYLLPSVYGGSNMIGLTDIPDHEHTTNLSGNYISSLSQGNYGIAAAGSYNVITSGTGSSFPSTTALMTNTSGTAVYSSTQSQSQYYGPFCAVMFIIKY